jgi:DNA-binding MarR family transcriptional regulator
MPKGRKKRATTRQPKSKAAPAADSLDIESVTGYNLRRAHSVQRQRFAAMFAPYGIRPVQLSILGLLRDHPRMKQSDLGRTLEIKRANIVVLLDELEQRGLIVRKPAETDRRAYVLELTAPGRKLAANLLALHAQLEAEVEAQLGTRDRDRLIELLKKFRRLETGPSWNDED